MNRSLPMTVGGIVRLANVDGDQPTGVTGDDRCRLGRAGAGAGEEVEREPGPRFFRPADQWQMERQWSVDEAMLGCFQALWLSWAIYGKRAHKGFVGDIWHGQR